MGGEAVGVEVIKVLQESEAKSGKTQMRIVRWIVNGRKYSPQLEKRTQFKTKAGEERSSKAKGLMHDDIAYVVAHWNDIEQLMLAED